MVKHLQIGPAKIKIIIDKKFKSLDNFLNQFPQSKDKKQDGFIRIKFAGERKILINKNKKILQLSGPDLDKIKNPLVEIAILQILFRFANFVTFAKPYLLLHGSTAIWDNSKSIIFGDNGRNIGKTLSAIEIALRSRKFVVDEFSIYDVENNSIWGINFLPIHIRNFCINYLNKKYKFHTKIVDSQLIKPSDLGLDVIPENQLSMVIYPDYQKYKKPTVDRLSLKESLKNLEILAASHLVKLLYPRYDRMSWVRQSDRLKIFNIRKECSKLANPIKPYLEQICQKVSSYRIVFNQPSQIYKLVKRAVNLEKRKIIEHTSASAVIYFLINKEIKILMLKKKDGKWVLPKGHIERGESPSRAALREAKEEVGLERGKTVRHVMTDRYTFRPNYGFATHIKKVFIYLIKGSKIRPRALQYEGFTEVGIFLPEEAVKKASFGSERVAIQEALKFIKNK
ncbi:MAG: NUDIX domain-containing protein [Patescibacteria group bacterium]